MFDFIAMRDRLAEFPIAEMLIGLCLLVLVAFIADFVVRRILTRLILRIVGRAVHDLDTLLQPVVRSFTRVVPAVIIHQGIGGVPHLAPGFVTLVQNVAGAFMIVAVAIGIGAGLDMANALYARSPRAHRRSIKGYLQVLKIVIYAIATILVIAALIDRSPLLLLSGLGALAAVLMLVFKDTILSLVASVQIGSNDMVRVGDWIEMPKLDANGDVIDIALHTVKVQNFDKTITTIPTYRLITESFRNWRGMTESGGRRMRSLMIDQNAIGFLDEEDIARLSRFSVLRGYLQDRQDQIGKWNAAHARDEILDARRLTNLGTFRAYVLAYLRSRPDIATDKTLLVRQLAPGEHGLPLEIYAFATKTVWAQYEDVQADIFDHLLAILPEFGLRIFQRPAGSDFLFLAGEAGQRPGRNAPALLSTPCQRNP